MRHLTNIALSLLLAGAGSSLLGFSAVVAALGARQAVRVAPLHPWGAAAGLIALPLGLTCWRIAQHRLDEDRFAAWRQREADA